MGAEYALTLIFGGLGIYILICTLKTSKELKFKDKMWSGSRIIFAVCAGVAVLSMFIAAKEQLIRLVAMLFCIVMFLLNRDGIGEKGVITLGKITPWSKVTAYDFEIVKDKFYIYYKVQEKPGDRPRDRFIALDGKNADEIKGFLKNTIGKKYKRMKKDER